MTQPVKTAFQQDIETINQAKDLPNTEMLVNAAKSSGINPIKITLDHAKLKRGRGKLRFAEYLRYGLYDRTKFMDDERERFISAFIHWPIFDDTTSREWWAVTEDKWLSGTFLEACDIPVPETVAVIDRSARLYPKTTVINDAAAFKAFLSKNSGQFFAKSQRSMWSAGAFVIESADTESIQIRGGDAVSYSDFFDIYIATGAFVLQKLIKPHSFFDGITDATATVRLINMINDDGVFNPFAVLKLPLGNSIADNFWRSDNLVCALDVDTGEILTLVGKTDMGYENLDSIPNTDRNLIGQILPFWNDIKGINETVALMHHEIKYGSTDIAITENGPVVVEVNCGSAFELPQIAYGKGFLTDEVTAFFRGAGSKRV